MPSFVHLFFYSKRVDNNFYFAQTKLTYRLDHLLFVAYLILFSWLVTKVGFFIKSGLNSTQLIIFFLLKVMAAILYGWLGVYYGQQLQMVDTWYFHYNSLKQYQLLLDHPWNFFTSLFQSHYEEGFSKFLTSKDSWWNDVKYLFFDKLLALFNLLSFGNYYINIIFYSFLTLFGPIALYRVMKNVFPNKDQILQISVFLVPSFLFWNSGIHKDGLVFLSFAVISYHLYFGFKEKNFSWQRAFFILLALTLLILRSFVLVILIPALLAWYISHKSKYNPIHVFGIIYLIFIFLFFTAHHLNPKINLMQAVAERQQEFMSLHGNSSIKVKSLEPTIIGFIKNTPQAINLTLLRPNPTDARHLFSLAACIETMLFLLLFALFLFFKRNDVTLTSFLIFCFALSLSMFLMIGYTVNILGAIVRYRSIVLPFLLPPIIIMTDWNKIKSLLHIKNFNYM
jgi:hypothetical protein